MTSTDSILQLISEIHIPGFFITVDFLQIGETTTHSAASSKYGRETQALR